MEKPINTAIVPVAGTGARMLPAASVTEKCLMPLYLETAAIPVIDFIVEDCVRAGLERVIFVTTDHGRNELRRYFDADVNPTLLELFETTSNYDKLNQERKRRERYSVEFEYVIQRTDKYGTATSLEAVHELVDGEDQIVMTGGDDFIYHADGTSELKLAIDSLRSSGADHTVIGVPVSPQEAAGRYGILVDNGLNRLRRIDEKPPLDKINSSPYANVSRYVLSKSIWNYVDAEMSMMRRANEHSFTDVVNAAIAGGEYFDVHHARGKYLDCGEPDGVFNAINFIRQHQAAE